MTAGITLNAADALADNLCVRVVATDARAYSCNPGYPDYCEPEYQWPIDRGEYGVVNDDHSAYWKLWDGEEEFWVSTSALRRRPDGQIDDHVCSRRD